MFVFLKCGFLRCCIDLTLKRARRLVLIEIHDIIRNVAKRVWLDQDCAARGENNSVEAILGPIKTSNRCGFVNPLSAISLYFGIAIRQLAFHDGRVFNAESHETDVGKRQIHNDGFLS